MKDVIHYEPKWIIRKYKAEAAEPYEVVEIPGNLLLDEGILALINLLTGAAETNFGNTNAYLGVGNGTTAASAAQTGLQGASKLYKAMEAGYPSRSGNTVTWRASYGSTDANFAWEEFTVANGNSDAGDNLNRKVSAQGTKTAGETWILDLQITFS